MSLRIGVIYCGYNTADLLERSLTPWIAARAARLSGHTFVICAVSVPFEGFDHGAEGVDGTPDALLQYQCGEHIDQVLTGIVPQKETEARGAALRYLVEKGVDVVWQIDSDEIFTAQDITRIATIVEAQPYVAAFRVSYQNLVFDEQHALAEPFTPMRIHRVYIAGGYRLWGFWDDNNAYYARSWEQGTADKTMVRDTDMPVLTIPPALANPLHYTWLSNERSKAKISYQVGRGWECSFRWDEITNQLAFNEPYYTKRCLPLPEVITLPTA